MGQFWLLDLPDVLRAAGLKVDTWPNWEARARSTGGYDKVLAVQVHHTASNTTPTNDMNYMWNSSPDKPIGAIYLARDGRVTVGAAGATNTSGKGGPLGTSGGTIPLDAANRYVISIEAANAGTGEPWPPAQTDAYVKMCKALCDRYGLGVALGDLHAHWEWTSRKVDPAGSSPYATGANKWDMDDFRRDVSSVDQPSPPTPIPTPPEGSPDMFIFIVTNGPGSSARETWLLCDGTQLAHVVNGYGAEVYLAAGVAQVKSTGADQTDGLIKSCKVMNDCPPEWIGTGWEALWNSRK